MAFWKERLATVWSVRGNADRPGSAPAARLTLTQSNHESGPAFLSNSNPPFSEPAPEMEVGATDEVYAGLLYPTDSIICFVCLILSA